MYSKKIITEFRNIVEKYKELELEQHLIFELNTAEVHTILLIGQNPNININTVAKLRNVTRSASSQLINKLYKNDYLTKKTLSDNQKEIILQLTIKGQKVLTEHKKQHQYIEDELQNLFLKYSDDDLKLISNFMLDIEKLWETLPWRK